MDLKHRRASASNSKSTAAPSLNGVGPGHESEGNLTSIGGGQSSSSKGSGTSSGDLINNGDNGGQGPHFLAGQGLVIEPVEYRGMSVPQGSQASIMCISTPPPDHLGKKIEGFGGRLQGSPSGSPLANNNGPLIKGSSPSTQTLGSAGGSSGALQRQNNGQQLQHYYSEAGLEGYGNEESHQVAGRKGVSQVLWQ